MILVGQMDSPFLRRVAVTMNHYGIGFEGQVKSGLQWLETEAPKPDQEPDPDPWFLGPELTQADVTAASVLTHAVEKRPQLFPLETYPALAALRDRAEALDIFKASPFEEG